MLPVKCLCAISLLLLTQTTAIVEWEIIEGGNCENAAGRHSFTNLPACLEAAKSYTAIFQYTKPAQIQNFEEWPPGCTLFYGGGGNEIIVNTDITTGQNVVDKTYSDNRHCSTGTASNARKCLCIKAPICIKTQGKQKNPEACLCGNSACTDDIGLFCFEQYNQCGRSQVKFVVVDSGHCQDVTGRNDIIISDSDRLAEKMDVCKEAAAFIGFGGVGSSSYKPAPSAVLPPGCSYNTQSDYVFQNTQIDSGQPSCSVSNPCLCFLSVPCLITDGQLRNPDSCMCGTASCTEKASGLFCYLPTATCAKQKLSAWLGKCVQTDGKFQNQVSCSCMQEECSYSSPAFNAVCKIEPGAKTGTCSCPAGRYEDNTGSCVACRQGKYQNEHSRDAKDACKICQRGKIATSSALSRCVNCARGSYNDDDAQEITEHDGIEDCKACVTGQTSESGTSFCFTCPVGYAFLETVALVACAVCPPGRMSEELTCKECQKGHYQPKNKTGFCLPCIPYVACCVCLLFLLLHVNVIGMAFFSLFLIFSLSLSLSLSPCFSEQWYVPTLGTVYLVS